MDADRDGTVSFLEFCHLAQKWQEHLDKSPKVVRFPVCLSVSKILMVQVPLNIASEYGLLD